jgi:hypothetical protein
MEYGQFERRILGLIFRSNVPLTPVHMAYHLDISIAESRLHLDRMVANGILELDSDERGNILFVYPLRPPLETLKPASPPRRRRRRRSSRAASDRGPGAVPALAPLVRIDEERSYSPAAAAALSLFLPGVGQIYSGRVPQGRGLDAGHRPRIPAFPGARADPAHLLHRQRRRRAGAPARSCAPSGVIVHT